MIRSFVAIPLPVELQQRLACLQRQLKLELPELRPSSLKNLHLSLLFLGDQSQEMLAEIGTRMRLIGGSSPAFSLTLRGLGSFPAGRDPRVIWLGVEPRPPLLTLQAALAEALCGLGLPREARPYRPHLTLGRLGRPPLVRGFLESFRPCDCGQLEVTQMVLFASRLTPAGAVHQPLREVALSL